MLSDLLFDIEHLPMSVSDFEAPSSIHGMGHTLRVAIFSSIIGRQIGDIRKGMLASYAAFFHDMARCDDGNSRTHGQNAAERILPRYVGFLKENGVTELEIAEICDAVRWHSLDEEMPQCHDHYTTTAILKDADALDRIRIKDLNTNFLRFEESRRLVPFAYWFYATLIRCVCRRNRSMPEMDEMESAIVAWLHDSSASHFDLVCRLNAFPEESVAAVTRDFEIPEVYVRVASRDFPLY